MATVVRGYLANGLFSMGDRYVNEVIAQEVRRKLAGTVDLYVPQENGEINDKNAFADSEMIADGDLSQLRKADFVIAVLDGIEIDSGVACEIGFAYAQGIPVFGLFTDVRQFGRDNKKKIDALVLDAMENQFIYRNLFAVGLIKKSGGGIYSDVDELVEVIYSSVMEALEVL